MKPRFRLLALSWLGVATFASAQGPLAPPGPPAPTMKTLDQIASTGIAINATNTPGDSDSEYVINAAGSYYLTGNVVTTKFGITVNAAGVTIDLNGFQMSGINNGGAGIISFKSADRCTIKNGSIVGFSSGIDMAGVGCTFLELEISGCSSYAIYLGGISEIRSCKIFSNPGDGIFAGPGSTISQCAVYANGGVSAISPGTGCTVTDCAITYNQTIYGIAAGYGCTITNCAVYGNRSTYGYFYGIAGGGCTIVNCTAQENEAPDGVAAAVGIFGNANSVIKNCAVQTNRGDGIQTGDYCNVTDCTSSRNGSGPLGSGIVTGKHTNVSGCTTVFNQANGIMVDQGCSVRDCVVSRNGVDGILANQANVIVANQVALNSGTGIHATGASNRIDNNSVLQNVNRGIKVDGSGNLIVRNTATANTNGNYLFAAGNANAVVVSVSSDFTSTDPMANLSY